MTKTTTSNAKNTKELSSNVTIIGSKLIVSLPNAQMPVVWQTDLEQAQSSSFTIKEDKKAKIFILISKMQDGTVNEIANFSDKQESVDILMEISNTLQNIHAQINMTVAAAPTTSQTLHDQQKSGARDNKIGAAIALSLIAVLLIIWIMSASNNLNTTKENGNNNISSANTRSSSGVAVSADDFLSNR